MGCAWGEGVGGVWLGWGEGVWHEGRVLRV